MLGRPFCTICNVWCNLEDDPTQTSRRGWFCPNCNTADHVDLNSDPKDAESNGVTEYEP